MELWLVADTNLFFECRPLEQLPWEELAHDPVVVLLAKPVLDEIDKHKKGTGRTRARALDVFSRVRTMLTGGTQEVELRPSEPRVLLRLESARPDPNLKDDLDYGKTDERLVGIVSTLRTAATERAVELFTDDTGPASTASGLRVPFRLIAEDWRRPPAESTEAKKIKELETDLATYRSQEPRISIEACEGASPENVVELTRRVAVALTGREIEDVLDALHAKHPPRTVFDPPPPTSVTKPSGEVVRTEYLAPEADAVAEYVDLLYPKWTESCRAILTTLHEGRDVEESALILRWPMSNVGTRPASQVRVEFEAGGPLRLARLPEQDVDDEEDVAVPSGTTETKAAVPLKRFPSPPRPPAFGETVTRTPPPARLKPVLRPQGASFASAADFLKRQDGGIARMMRDLDSTTLAQARHLAVGGVMGDVSRRFAASSALDAISRSAFQTTVFPTPLAVPRLPQIPRHDPEAFYWDWPLRAAVKKGALTCDLWRHKGEVELFTFQVEFERDGTTRGTVTCTVHAGNLTEPEQAMLIVGRSVATFGVRDVADAMVAACT